MGIDGDDRVIGRKKLHHPPHTRVAADKVPIKEVQGRPFATGTELEERRRRRARLHGDFWRKLPNCFCPEQIVSGTGWPTSRSTSMSISIARRESPPVASLAQPDLGFLAGGRGDSPASEFPAPLQIVVNHVGQNGH